MNKEATSIEKFFRELSRRMYKENDLSDMVYALCRSNLDFMQFFLNFIFGVEKLNASDFRIEREVSFEKDRPDFVLTKKDSGERYFIEVKIGDRSQHFAQYSTQLAKLNKNSNLDFNVIDDVAYITKYLGYITNSYENICQYAKSLWRFPHQSRLLDVSLSPIRNVGRLSVKA